MTESKPRLDLPPPPVPVGCDLRDFVFMPLDVQTLRDSAFSKRTSGDEFRAGVMLWCAAWHQVPAGSLPDDDRELSALAGYGFVMKEWRKVKLGALAKFVKCSDGRLYHPEISKKANNSWNEKLRFRWRRECDRRRKHNERQNDKLAIPSFESWLSEGVHLETEAPSQCAPVVPVDDSLSNGSTADVLIDKGDSSGGQMGDVPLETPLKGEGEGEGEIREKKKGVEDGLAKSAPPPKAQRGCRLPENWEPRPEDCRVAHELGLNASDVLAGFRDYWKAKAGKDAVKMDWDATWRNWLRNQRQPMAATNTGKTAFRNGFAEELNRENEISTMRADGGLEFREHKSGLSQH